MTDQCLRNLGGGRQGGMGRWDNKRNKETSGNIYITLTTEMI